jgi:DNA polymerase-1
MGPYGLKDRLKIGVDEAVIFIQTYFHTYPSVKEWINSQIEFARNYGYTQTLFGRKRWLPHINSNSPYLRSMDERVAVNTPIQGTVADMMKIAMLRIEEKLNSYPAEIIMQIHDELVLEVKEEVVEEVKEIVKTEMENLVDIGVPLKVDVGISTNWWDIHK